MSAVGQEIAAIVKAHDRDRYVATLFAPEEKRADLFALYALDAEITRIRALVSDPLPGEIRLQWWREVINGERAGEATGNALATAIRDVIKRHLLPLAVFESYFDARTFDFYNDPFPGTTELEAWCGETYSAIMQMACIILDKENAQLAADACGYGGVAKGIADILQRLPRTRGRGQCYLPSDLLTACGLDAAAFVKGEDKTKLKAATDALSALGTSHLEKHRLAARNLPKPVKPAFLPAANAGLTFKAATRSSVEPAFGVPEISALRRLIGIMGAAVR